MDWQVLSSWLWQIRWGLTIFIVEKRTEVRLPFCKNIFSSRTVVVTWKIGSFLCSLDNLLQKNVIVFFFGNQIAKWRSFEKRAIFDLLLPFF